MSRLGTYIVGGVAAAFSAGAITAVALGQDDSGDDDSVRSTFNQQAGTATIAGSAAQAFTPTPDNTGDTRQSTPEGATTQTTSSTTPNGTTGGDLQTFDAGDAGTITVHVNGRNLTLESVAANAGWEWREDDQDDNDEVEVYFFRDDTRIKVEVEHDDGGIKHEVESDTRRTGSGSDSSERWDDDDDQDD